MATETTEDFEAEYSEALAREVSGPGQEGHEEDLQLEPLALETHSDADRRLRSIRYWQGELEKIRETAAVEYERVEAWVEKHEQRINKRLKWNEDALRPYLWSTGKKSVDLPSGQIRRRVGRERVEVVPPDLQEQSNKPLAPKCGSRLYF